MQSGAVVVDDRSSQIDYTTDWYNDVIGQGTDYNQTVSVSGNQNAGFQFTFHGTSIAVYGSIPPNNTAVSTYIVDLSAPVSYTNVPSSVYTSRHLCFQSPTLPYGEHTLVVDIPESTIGHDWTQFYFDFLAYTPSNSSAGASSPSASSSGSSAVSPTGAAAEQTTASSSASKPALRTILPAVLVPCIVCIALLALALVLMRRRMRRAVPHAPETSARPFFAATYGSAPPSTPHTLKGPTSAPSSSSSALSSALPALPSGGGYSMAELSPGAAPSPTAVVSPTLASSPTAVPTPGGGDGMARVHEWAYAGGSVGAPSVATQEPPPVYRP
ncbi:hypothetical protein PHLGIDRAFT_127796 [Phlebiopsis gigantea 11061_1 CR5-6]|uniref:Uncharacterized protein n=1 Tax=Phlebiopsis gigantea (strain 11061_1 CR5-6) TaxID=745531 RepID=A0A0C3RYG0_PHLG1|nr:hypothetical protein PHLGIDRAFT_127796 [Phlebiopsis gigantea 11061_1 CR5-6]